MRRIFKAIRANEKECRTRSSWENIEILYGKDLIKFRKSQRLRSFSNVREKDAQEEYGYQDIYRDRRGRPRASWKDQVLEDISVIGFQVWARLVKSLLGGIWWKSLSLID